MPKSELAEREPDTAAYKMPQPGHGQAILYYNRAIVQDNNIIIGYCTAVSDNNIEVNLGGRLIEGVCHVSDPRLKNNEHARKFGAWDFTSRDKDLDAAIARIAALERAISAK